MPSMSVLKNVNTPHALPLSYHSLVVPQLECEGEKNLSGFTNGRETLEANNVVCQVHHVSCQESSSFNSMESKGLECRKRRRKECQNSRQCLSSPWRNIQSMPASQCRRNSQDYRNRWCLGELQLKVQKVVPAFRNSSSSRQWCMFSSPPFKQKGGNGMQGFFPAWNLFL